MEGFGHASDGARALVNNFEAAILTHKEGFSTMNPELQRRITRHMTMKI